ncbi:MAG: hypothetical protein BRC58_02690 [Cyanobacteria bacterium QS_8_64_29]|nr:MAG: hypothetical protein BRC58_02690 [Cyanobacteria bacterium QS_8_64_29]
MPSTVQQRFQPQQMVILAHAGYQLYSEVVQTVPSRPLCWVRPMALAVLPAHDELPPAEVPSAATLYDLRQTTDLILPATLFRGALDTEVLPLMSRLAALESPSPGDGRARLQLRAFIEQVWRAYRHSFPPA